MNEINLHPSICKLCGGKVVFYSNSIIYNGKEYGSGRCYLCLKCKAYVGTHKPRPREAFGILADSNMRKGKMLCHELFDKMWKGKPKARKKRRDLYLWLSRHLNIDFRNCHFGYFDLNMLRKAYLILKEHEGEQLIYGNKAHNMGLIINGFKTDIDFG